jgi:hypothetical protein
MDRRITFYYILLVTTSALIFSISNYQIINASSTDIKNHDKKNKDNNNINTHDKKNKDNNNINTHDKKNKDNNNINTHDNRKSIYSEDSSFSLPFNSNFADQSIKTNNEKNDIIPFP